MLTKQAAPRAVASRGSDGRGVLDDGGCGEAMGESRRPPGSRARLADAG
jgi:hypothetical protein